jgi:hypothetical protein
MQQQIGSSRLPTVRTCHPPLTAHGTPRSSCRTPCHNDDLDHRNSRRRARLCCSAPPRAWGGRTAQGVGLTASLCSWGGQTARRALDMTASLYVRQAVPSYRGTLRCTRDYPSTTASLLMFSRSLIGITSLCRMSTSQRRHPQWTRLLLCALQPAIIATLVVEPSTSEASPIQAVAPHMPVRHHL